MREDAYIQINRWEGCAMYNRDGEKEELQYRLRLSTALRDQHREAQRNMFHLANIPAVPHLPYAYN